MRRKKQKERERERERKVKRRRRREREKEGAYKAYAINIRFGYTCQNNVIRVTDQNENVS